MPTSFSKKIIEVNFTIASGDFGGGNAKSFQGNPISVNIRKPGLPEKNSADLTIGGLSLSDMENLTDLSFQSLESQKNLIQIKAGSEDEQLSVIFEGEISMASADFSAHPNVKLSVEAISGYYPQRMEPKAESVQGETQVAGLISQWANEMEYAFVNNGVSLSVKNAVFFGSPLEKIISACKQVGIECIIDNKTVLIQPFNSVRQGEAPLLSKETGLIEYPTFNQDGIVASCFFRPDIEIGGAVKVESIVPRASGTWKVTSLEHNLSAFETNPGPWQTNIEGQTY